MKDKINQEKTSNSRPLQRLVIAKKSVELDTPALSIKAIERQQREFALKIIELLSSYNLSVKQIKDILNAVPKVIDETYSLPDLNLAKTSSESA